MVDDNVRVGRDDGGNDEGVRVKYWIGSDCIGVSLSDQPFANLCSPEHCHVLLHLPGDYWCSDTRRSHRSHERDCCMVNQDKEGEDVAVHGEQLLDWEQW